MIIFCYTSTIVKNVTIIFRHTIIISNRIIFNYYIIITSSNSITIIQLRISRITSYVIRVITCSFFIDILRCLVNNLLKGIFGRKILVIR